MLGQQEVYDFLKTNKGKWFTSKEISQKLKISIGSVQTSLKKLRKSQAIGYRMIGKGNTFQYTFIK